MLIKGGLPGSFLTGVAEGLEKHELLAGNLWPKPGWLNRTKNNFILNHYAYHQQQSFK
jgi:hypothetical protein